jgi:hypothetical protein
MAGYIGSKTSVSVVSPETDSRYVNVTGDTMTGALTATAFVGDGSGLTNLPASGTLLGSAHAATSTALTASGSFPLDATIPQSNEGVQLLTLNYTPQSSTSKLIVFAGSNASGYHQIAVFASNSTNAIAATAANQTAANGFGDTSFIVGQIDSPGTSQLTFQLRGGSGSGTAYFNRYFSGTGNAAKTTITVMEVQQ